MYVMTSKGSAGQQKHVMKSKSLSVVTSETRHDDVKEFVMTSKTRHDGKKFVMTSK